jgi:hypothetical protein
MQVQSVRSHPHFRSAHWHWSAEARIATGLWKAKRAVDALVAAQAPHRCWSPPHNLTAQVPHDC